ncbi:MAG: leucyl aminopeptidase [Proteobacteria bacterium]|nr:leucyl aminopeptidase [Pseudomonadota bacterium]
MNLTISFQTKMPARSDAVIVPVYRENKLPPAAQKLDKSCGGLISHHLKKQSKFKGDRGQILTIAAPRSVPCAHIILAGLGEALKLDLPACEAAGGKAFLALAAAGAQTATFLTDDMAEAKKVKAAAAAAHMAFGAKLRSYRFDRYKTAKSKDGSKPLSKIIVCPGSIATDKAYKKLDKVAGGIFLARDLVNEPPNMLYPDSFAKRIQRELTPLGVEVEIFDEKKMKKLGFGAHLAVGQGSAFKPRVVVMRWHGGVGKKGKAMKSPLAFVGKGLTFDTGGVNLKPTGGVEDMKYDMGGAASVVGLMKVLAARKCKTPVVGIVGLAENALDGSSYRPSDILRSLSGKTIEVLNTDAEGRLVLADALTYVQRNYKPRFVIDLATLTGAIVVALGAEYCGLFSNSDKLWEQMDRAGAASGEPLWRMPLNESFSRELDSHIADVKSIGNLGRNAGSSIAACFLERFIEDKTPWAHMDIAGVAFAKSEKPFCPKGSGTGFGIRLLDRLIADHYET